MDAKVSARMEAKMMSRLFWKLTCKGMPEAVLLGWRSGGAGALFCRLALKDMLKTAVLRPRLADSGRSEGGF